MSEERRTGWEGADRWFAGGAPPPPEDPPPGDGTPPAPEPVCEVCGAPLEADQTYCLECGSPTPLAPRLRRGGRNLAVLAGAVAILGLGAGALAYAVVDDDGDGGGTVTTSTTATAGTGSFVPLPPETAATTGPLPPDTSFTSPTAPILTVPTGPSTGFDTVTGPGTVTAPPSVTDPITSIPDPGTTVEAPEPVDPDPDPDTGATDWPAGASAWTAILSSVRDEADARAAKTRVSGAGEPAGVLYSSDFDDLRPGYWVLFSGRYSERGDAIAQATRMRPEFPGAYARRLSG